MYQTSFCDVEYTLRKLMTKRKEFLKFMCEIIT